MSEPRQPLLNALARIGELCVVLGKSREDVLDVPRLARAAGVTAREVETLFDGEIPPDEDPDRLVRRRVRLLYEAHPGGNGKPRDIREIAAAINSTTTWAKKLVHGQASPNIHVGSALCKFYEVDKGFLTDSPAEALLRELRHILFDLEVEADPEQALRNLGVVHISGRNPNQFRYEELTALTRMVAEVASTLDGVKDKLARMGYAEDER
ncbi:hypothetical protein [Streptomyces sp. NPDC050534]|uniref:hypothetical protein n=1 Tax=Streptomyces sp. NPDC050534 TaxID=3365625 RepID=UPI0037A3999E